MRTSQEKLLTCAIDNLYACATEASAWPDALQALARVFDSPRVSLLQASAAVDRVTDLKGFNFDPAAESLYNRHYWQLDPTLEAARRARPGDWEDCSSLFDPRTTPHREYVHDYALPSGLRWVAGGKVHGDAERCIILGLQRPGDARPFGTDCAGLFDRLRPHLRRVCLIDRELRAVRGQAAMSGAAINGLQQAALVVSCTGALLFANEAGERQLRTGIPLLVHNGRLVATGGGASWLEAAIRAATAPQHRHASDHTERAPDGSDWILRVVPMGDGAGCALVYVGSSQRQLASTSLLERLFSLTPAEAEIARQLTLGLSVKEVAYARCVSELTVRSQVRSIIAKTGARRLSGLQALVRSVPLLANDPA